MKNFLSCLMVMASAVTLASLAGCVGMSKLELNDPSRALLQQDNVNSSGSKGVPYEWQEIEGLKVGFNLTHTKGDNFAGYRVSLMIRNTSGASLTVTPKVTLLDGNRIALQPQDLSSLAGMAAALARTPIPAVVLNTPPSSYYHTGTITNKSGESYRYSGYSSPGSGGGGRYAVSSGAAEFSQGYAMGAAIAARKERDEGGEMLNWAATHWLRSEYVMQPDNGVIGVLFFTAPKIGALPMILTVDLGGKLFVFTSRTTL